MKTEPVFIMNRARNIIFFSVFVICLTSAGCAWFETKEQPTAQELAVRGMDFDKREKYRKSLETFQHLKDWYPFSKFAGLAELKIADAHYHLEEYEEAIFAYREFESLHPRNEAIPYVIYQTGRCYFDRMDSVDRDQTVVRQALEVFQRLVAQHPTSAYSAKAKSHITECKKSLAGHEMYVGRYYYRSGKYKGALARFQAVLRLYPDTGFEEKAREYIKQCRAALKKQGSGD
jgi:outer membrane protein assembly factor BamD